jgi:hypothetical protein
MPAMGRKIESISKHFNLNKNRSGGFHAACRGFFRHSYSGEFRPHPASRASFKSSKAMLFW